MHIPHYFEIFFMLLLASTLVITGWHLSTDGKETKMPDGSIERTGNIFRGWRFFWMQERSCKCAIMYNGQNATMLIPRIMNYVGGLRGENNGPFVLYVNNPDAHARDGEIIASKSILPMLRFIENELDIILRRQHGRDIEFAEEGNIILKAGIDNPNYVFPWWLRKMMASCITCHASVYGSILFVVFHNILGGEEVRAMYSCFPNIFVGMIATWIAYTFSLAYTLTFAYKKL